MISNRRRMTRMAAGIAVACTTEVGAILAKHGEEEKQYSDYDAFVSKANNLLVAEMKLELEKRNLSMVFRMTDVPRMDFAAVMSKQAVELPGLGTTNGRPLSVLFNKFMEASMLVPDNKPNPDFPMLGMYMVPCARSLVDAVEKDVRELRVRLPLFTTEPPVFTPRGEVILAAKCMTIFGQLPVRSQMSLDESGRMILTNSVLYGSSK